MTKQNNERNLEYYKYYPRGDRDKQDRDLGVGLKYNTETKKWYFTGQNKSLDNQYLEQVHMNVRDKIGKIVRLKDDGWSETRTNIVEVLNNLPSREKRYDY